MINRPGCHLDAGVAHAKEIGWMTVVERGREAAQGLPERLVYAGASLGVMPAESLAQTRPGPSGLSSSTAPRRS